MVKIVKIRHSNGYINWMNQNMKNLFLEKYLPKCCFTCTKFSALYQVIFIFHYTFSPLLWHNFFWITPYFTFITNLHSFPVIAKSHFSVQLNDPVDNLETSTRADRPYLFVVWVLFIVSIFKWMQWCHVIGHLLRLFSPICPCGLLPRTTSVEEILRVGGSDSSVSHRFHPKERRLSQKGGDHSRYVFIFEDRATKPNNVST